MVFWLWQLHKGSWRWIIRLVDHTLTLVFKIADFLDYYSLNHFHHQEPEKSARFVKNTLRQPRQSQYQPPVRQKSGKYLLLFLIVSTQWNFFLVVTLLLHFFIPFPLHLWKISFVMYGWELWHLLEFQSLLLFGLKRSHCSLLFVWCSAQGFFRWGWQDFATEGGKLEQGLRGDWEILTDEYKFWCTAEEAAAATRQATATVFHEGWWMAQPDRLPWAVVWNPLR